MFMKLSTQLKRALDEANSNANEQGVFTSDQCYTEDGNIIDEQFYIELERQCYIRYFFDGGGYQLLSKAKTYDEDLVEYERRLAAMSSSIINVTGSHNVQVQQNTSGSAQTMNIEHNADIKKLFEDILAIVKENDFENQQAIESAIIEMKQAIGKPTYSEKYNAFIQSVANHMTAFAPFIPQLTLLLSTTTSIV